MQGQLLFVLLTICLAGCATNTTPPTSFQQVVRTADLRPKDFDVDFKEQASDPGPLCTVQSATKKRCYVPQVVLQGPDWQTFFGAGPTHWVEIEQIGANQVAAEYYVNFYSAGAVAAAFDPDMHVAWRFFNSGGFAVGEFTDNLWRSCVPQEAHHPKFVLPGNLSFVKDTAFMMVIVDYRQTVKGCH